MCFEDATVFRFAGERIGTLSFLCSTCNTIQLTLLDGGQLSLLGACITIPVQRRPMELLEEIRYHSSSDLSPICADDILDLHELLNEPDWFERVI